MAFARDYIRRRLSDKLADARSPGWLGQSQHSTENARRTTKDTTLVSHPLYVGDLAQAIRERILQHTESNPFYVDEILRSLIHGWIIVRDEASHRWEMPSDASDIPNTSHGVIAVRIGPLDEELKQMLAVGSV